MPLTSRPTSTPMTPEEAVRRVGRARDIVLNEVHKVIIGQDEMIEQMLIAMFARGHCLTIGVPGLAKTLTVSTLAQALHLKFSRIQFTPDLMPSDITGTEIIEEDAQTGRRVFRFVRGPVFANIVLADEINRTPPKTQSALLQSMQEYQVTAAGNTYDLDKPFFVMRRKTQSSKRGLTPFQKPSSIASCCRSILDIQRKTRNVRSSMPRRKMRLPKYIRCFVHATFSGFSNWYGRFPRRNTLSNTPSIWLEQLARESRMHPIS